MKGDRDFGLIVRMIDHCNRILEIKERFGNSFDVFSKDTAYQDAVNMNLFQIGELSNHLSGSFKEIAVDIPWHMMYGIRNILAHAYVIVDKETVWLTVEKDIPVLIKQLSKYINE
jgi:uncharacterized protein with HEPN domain